jgi:prepilin-type processing-associated H-X9-DG protein
MKSLTRDRTPHTGDDAGYSQDFLASRRSSRSEVRENRVIAAGLVTLALVGGGVYYALNQGGGESRAARQQQIENAANAAWADGHDLPNSLPPATGK